MQALFDRIRETRIIPVVKIDDAGKALSLAQALINGGLRCAEITFRTSAAVEAIELITAEFPEMLIGAGTVLSSEQADAAWKAGADFIVSPGFNPITVSHCVYKGMPIIPGCATASEIEQALSLGLNTVKLFPAEVLGGVKLLKALSAPFTGINFVPTGGIAPENICEYLALDCVIACGGSWMVKSSLINEERFDEIERLTREAVRLAGVLD